MENYPGHPFPSEVQEKREANHALKDNRINTRKENPTLKRTTTPLIFFLSNNKEKMPIEQQKLKK